MNVGSEEKGNFISAWFYLHLISYVSSLSDNLLIGAALSLEDIVDDLCDGVADTDTRCGSRDGQTLRVN